jgi:hypothetical protein
VADLSMETLLHPPFEQDPPVKLNVNAKILGLVLALVFAIFALFSFIGIFPALGLSALGSVLGVSGIWILVLVGAIIAAIADALVAWGGYKMYQLDAGGKTLVIYGLALSLVASVVGAIGSYNPVGIVGAIVINGIIWYLVIISRFPGETPLVASGTGTGAPPPPPPSA